MESNPDGDPLAECYSCGEDFEEGDWVIVLDAFKAALDWSDELRLNPGERVETAVHARCLKHGN